MSEYQYYQFVAIDRPLTERQMVELRDISTRAEITPTSFINEYHWGDLKANPLDFMKKYFDAHLYVANWGTHRLMLRIPEELIDVDAARQYCTEDSLAIHVHRNRVIVDFTSDSDDHEWDSGEGWLSSLLPLRDDLMQGDLRSLYLGWLAGLWLDEDETYEDQPKPPTPPGLRKLSGPLEALADFLRVDPDLLDAAMDQDTGTAPVGPSPKDLAVWVKKLPATEKNRFLIELLSGEQPSAQLVGGLRQRFRKDWHTTHVSTPPPSISPPSTARLVHTRHALAEERRRREAERIAQEQAERERKAVEERSRHLEEIAAKEKQIWKKVESLLRTTKQDNYDKAVGWLQDLRDVAATKSRTDEWKKRVAVFRQRHWRKSSLMRRFDTAEFPY